MFNQKTFYIDISMKKPPKNEDNPTDEYEQFENKENPKSEDISKAGAFIIPLKL